jgi:hypothetical protein
MDNEDHRHWHHRLAARSSLLGSLCDITFATGRAMSIVS